MEKEHAILSTKVPPYYDKYTIYIDMDWISNNE